MAEDNVQNEQPKQDETKQTDQEKESSKGISRDQLGSIVKEQVAKALADNNKQWQDKLNDEVAKAKQDGKDEATMSAKELAEKQAKDRQEALDQRADELKKLSAELDHRDHIAHTKDLLSEQHLPTGIAETVLGETEEETKKNIQQYKDLVDQGVRNELHRSSTQKEPQAGQSTETATKPDKPLADMNYEEMQAYLDSQQNN